jgi:inner membrane transporter RhtA
VKIFNRASTFSPTSLVLFSIASTQLGSAIAKGLFATLHPAAFALLRVAFAAAVLMVWWQPRIKEILKRNAGLLILFGLSLSLMNFSFYLAIARIPVGIAVAIEFLGPLGVALFNSRQLLDFIWVVLAGGGIFLLAPFGDFSVDLIGIGLALVAGGLWAVYILLSAKVGQTFLGGAGLALAMTIGALSLAPIGLLAGGAALLEPHILLIGFGVALLSSVLPYSLELEALRKLPVRVFGVLMSLEPVVAAFISFVLLGETLELRALLAIISISVAAAGVSLKSDRTH